MGSEPTNPTAESATCERCGSFDVIEMGGQFLCADCISNAGCSCAGHASDDEN